MCDIYTLLYFVAWPATVLLKYIWSIHHHNERNNNKKSISIELKFIIFFCWKYKSVCWLNHTFLNVKSYIFTLNDSNVVIIIYFFFYLCIFFLFCTFVPETTKFSALIPMMKMNPNSKYISNSFRCGYFNRCNQFIERLKWKLHRLDFFFFLVFVRGIWSHWRKKKKTFVVKMIQIMGHTNMKA